MKRTMIGLVLLGATAGCGAHDPPAPTTASVTQTASANGSYAYGFDPAGLPTSVGTVGTAYGIVRQTGAIAAGADTYRVDPLGRVSAIDGLAIAYGPDGHIDHATSAAATVSYLYDETGQRILKSVGAVPAAAYPEEGYLTANELDEPVRIGDRLVGLVRGGAFVLAATDTRGTIEADTDGTSRLASPFGARPVHPDVAAAFDYAGHGFDADLGLERMGVRDYDPRIASFLEPDPFFLLQPGKCVESPVECNLYGYARNRPLDFTDPTGRNAFQVSAQVQGFAGVDLRVDRHGDFSLRLDVGQRSPGPQNSSFNLGATTRDLLHDEVSGFVRGEAGARIGGLNLAWAQIELRGGTATGLKLDGSLASVPGRIGASIDSTSRELKPYGDLGGRRDLLDAVKPDSSKPAFAITPPRVRVGGGVSINSREVRRIPGQVVNAITNLIGDWDRQARQMILAQPGWH